MSNMAAVAGDPAGVFFSAALQKPGRFAAGELHRRSHGSFLSDSSNEKFWWYPTARFSVRSPDFWWRRRRSARSGSIWKQILPLAAGGRLRDLDRKYVDHGGRRRGSGRRFFSTAALRKPGRFAPAVLPVISSRTAKEVYDYSIKSLFCGLPNAWIFGEDTIRFRDLRHQYIKTKTHNKGCFYILCA